MDTGYNYIGQVWKAIDFYNKILKSKKVILAGDFNSNVIWDKLKRKSNHTMVIEKLESLGIKSSYHSYSNEIPGKETLPTFFMYHHENKAYHIDYCFASKVLTNSIKSVEIGTHLEWSKRSDHIPLSVNFDI